MGGEITMGRGLHDERGFSLLVAEGGNITNGIVNLSQIALIFYLGPVT
jgi:hypothetical protein